MQVMPGTELESAVPAPREWWERARDRIRTWQASHEDLVQAIRFGWLVICGAGAACLLAASVMFPNVRAAAGVYVSVVSLLVGWFVMARTRTLTFGAFTLLYGACVVWSIGIEAISLWLTDAMPASWLLRGATTFGPSVGIAAVTEESLKLLPMAVLVVLAPGRVIRFAAVDWLLVGLASGAGFWVVEESQRRLSSAGGGYDGVLSDGVTQYAGHEVMTGLVGGAVGLGIVLWRVAGRFSSPVKFVHRLGALGLPLLLLWVAIADHVVLNADTVLPAGDASSRYGWLQPLSTVAAPFKWWYSVGGHGRGRMDLLAVLLVLCLLCDAARAPRLGWWAVVPWSEPVWADRTISWLNSVIGRAEAPGLARALRAGVAAALSAAVSLAFVVTRDLVVGVAAHARLPGESRRESMLRGRAVLVMQRETRELAAGLDARSARRWVYRVTGLVAAGALIVLGLIVAPRVAVSLGWDTSFATRWLAGLFEGLAYWWNTLSPGQQLLLTVALAALIAIPFGFGVGFFLAGGLTYLAAHGEGVASVLRDPRAATTDYLANRSVGGMALDAGEFALTFVPAGLGSVGGVAARTAARGAAAREAELYLTDPVAWRAARAARESGELSLGFLDRLPRINGMRPRGHALAGKVWHGEAVEKMKAWPDAVRKAYPNGIRYSKSGFADFTPYAARTEKLVDGFTGVRRLDERLANQLAGFKRTPDHFTWHHVEDGHTMQLVPSDLHQAVPHTGGHAIGKP